MTPEAATPEASGTPIREIDISEPFGHGWRLVQYEGDRAASRWWVLRRDAVKGRVERYVRKTTGKKSGWEAFVRVTDGRDVHLDGESNGGWRPPDFLHPTRALAVESVVAAAKRRSGRRAR
jgi:hypothetical protein